MKKCLSILVIALTFAAVSCKKPAGEGGNSTITGTVHVTNYNANFTSVNNEYPGADMDVYIIYGDDLTYGNKGKTGPDGVFEFKYLRKGSYRVYVYSKDKDAYLSGETNAPDMAVFADGEITGRKQTCDVGTMEVYN